MYLSSILSISIILAATLAFVPDSVILREGINLFYYVQLSISNVPAGGLEGMLEIPLIVSPSGASMYLLFAKSLVTLIFVTSLVC